MELRSPTLLDILTSQQFQTVTLLALGLDTCQIADLLDTSELTVYSSLSTSFDRAGCRSAEGLAVRLLFEHKNNLYDERLDKTLAELQSAGKRMLKQAGRTCKLSASGASKELPATWVM